MAIEKFSQLPPAIALDGSELVCISQNGNEAVPWVTKRTTTSSIASLLNSNGDSNSTCSMRQLFAALASLNAMVDLFQALPGDMTNQYNIAWWHAYRMTIIDPFVTQFLAPTLGYDQDQLVALFILAQGFPV